jgi:hypothetical protein
MIIKDSKITSLSREESININHEPLYPIKHGTELLSSLSWSSVFFISCVAVTKSAVRLSVRRSRSVLPSVVRVAQLLRPSSPPAQLLSPVESRLLYFSRQAAIVMSNQSGVEGLPF